MLMQKRPQHRIIIPDEIWDFYAKLHNKLDPADDMRRVLIERMKLLDTPIQQAKLPSDDWDIKDWCEHMKANNYYGQSANEGYQSVHYQVITGTFKENGKPVANPFHNKTFAMIEDKEKERNLWSAVMSGFNKYIRERK